MVKNWRIAAAVTAVLAGGLLAATSFSPHAPDEALLLVSRGSEPPGGPLHFTLEGKSVRGLHPGATRQMRIAVRNPLGVRISLQHLTAKVSSTSRRGCPATEANLQVRRYSGHLPVTVAATGRTDLAGSFPVVMPLGASEKCAGADFVITLTGVGHRMTK
ncbi:hypothetical protein [Actinoplanes sp. G11-F43]|uniref:hypothetical protein n=1 Tax=Actinoplanes sp. G11-F43 TaxID=3424130 RepID=UPI003D342EC2